MGRSSYSNYSFVIYFDKSIALSSKEFRYVVISLIMKNTFDDKTLVVLAQGDEDENQKPQDWNPIIHFDAKCENGQCIFHRDFAVQNHKEITILECFNLNHGFVEIENFPLQGSTEGNRKS